jgi:hypothetical protein
MVGGMSKLGQGDLMGGLTSLVPRVVRDAMKASNLAQKGLTDSRGNTVLAPSQIGLGGIAAQAVGFQPAAVSEAREGRAAVQEAKFEGDAQRAKLAQAWLAAEPADRPAIAAQIRMFNNAGRAPPLLMDQLYRELAAKQQARKQPSVFGVRLGQHSASIGQAGNFANP